MGKNQACRFHRKRSMEINHFIHSKRREASCWDASFFKFSKNLLSPPVAYVMLMLKIQKFVQSVVEHK